MLAGQLVHQRIVGLCAQGFQWNVGNIAQGSVFVCLAIQAYFGTNVIRTCGEQARIDAIAVAHFFEIVSKCIAQVFQSDRSLRSIVQCAVRIT
ncbi:hypothetical protein D3C72_1300750 [compost metagenome]